MFKSLPFLILLAIFSFASSELQCFETACALDSEEQFIEILNNDNYSNFAFYGNTTFKETVTIDREVNFSIIHSIAFNDKILGFNVTKNGILKIVSKTLLKDLIGQEYYIVVESMLNPENEVSIYGASTVFNVQDHAQLYLIAEKGDVINIYNCENTAIVTNSFISLYGNINVINSGTAFLIQGPIFVSNYMSINGKITANVGIHLIQSSIGMPAEFEGTTSFETTGAAILIEERGSLILKRKSIIKGSISIVDSKAIFGNTENELVEINSNKDNAIECDGCQITFLGKVTVIGKKKAINLQNKNSSEIIFKSDNFKLYNGDTQSLYNTNNINLVFKYKDIDSCVISDTMTFKLNENESFYPVLAENEEDCLFKSKVYKGIDFEKVLVYKLNGSEVLRVGNNGDDYILTDIKAIRTATGIDVEIDEEEEEQEEEEEKKKEGGGGNTKLIFIIVGIAAAIIIIVAAFLIYRACKKKLVVDNLDTLTASFKA